jgi:hypothetical protein
MRPGNKKAIQTNAETVQVNSQSSVEVKADKNGFASWTIKIYDANHAKALSEAIKLDKLARKAFKMHMPKV